MKVSLLHYTGKGYHNMYAADLLIFTKNTRLNMTVSSFKDVENMPFEEKYKALEYMSNTIPSSWEFLDYIFVIEGVGRGFTHQFVRTRQGSYAQQSMRVTDMSGFEYVTPEEIKKNPEAKEKYQSAMKQINAFYQLLLDCGAEIQDARGVLPTNICTNIVAKFNLRTLSEMAMKRSSIRTQDEYRQVLSSMLDCVIEVHPWAKLFLRNRKIEAAAELEKLIKQVYGEKLDGEGIHYIKMLDIMRGV